MKYIVVLGDGMADYKRGTLGDKTPLMLAKKPAIDLLAKKGQVGLIRTVDEGLSPGSDVANLSVIGYDPRQYYSGRSSLEALSIGVTMNETDTVLRMNLVTLSEAEKFEDRTMLDYSAGEISTEEAHELVSAVSKAFADGFIEFFGGTSYRNCAVIRDTKVDVSFTPPHDILDKKIGEYLPKGEGNTILNEMIKKSVEVLSNHPVNLERISQGKRPANAIWFWGKATKPSLPAFKEKYGLSGAVISAVDLLKGIAIAAGMDVVNVDGATGTLKTNFAGKAQACLDALKNHDYVYIHIEAPDECGHQGDAEGKIKAIEKVDFVVDYIVKGLQKEKTDFCMAVLPDHATPLVLRTHTSDPVPYIVYNSLREANSNIGYTEEEAQKGLYLDNGRSLIQLLLKS